jgi:hypothetical protein
MPWLVFLRKILYSARIIIQDPALRDVAKMEAQEEEDAAQEEAQVAL